MPDDFYNHTLKPAGLKRAKTVF